MVPFTMLVLFLYNCFMFHSSNPTTPHPPQYSLCLSPLSPHRAWRPTGLEPRVSSSPTCAWRHFTSTRSSQP